MILLSLVWFDSVTFHVTRVVSYIVHENGVVGLYYFVKVSSYLYFFLWVLNPKIGRSRPMPVSLVGSSRSLGLPLVFFHYCAEETSVCQYACYPVSASQRQLLSVIENTIIVNTQFVMNLRVIVLVLLLPAVSGG